MKEDRFLTAILVGIGLLVVLALGLFFLRQRGVDYQPEDTPAGVLHNYALALFRGDHPRAYQYLAEMPNKPDYTGFRQAFITGQLNPNNASLKIGETQIDGEEALVAITVLQSNSGPFGDVFSSPGTAILKRQEGSWKISSLPYPYFNWDWYQSPLPEKLPAPAD